MHNRDCAWRKVTTLNRPLKYLQRTSARRLAEALL